MTARDLLPLFCFGFDGVDNNYLFCLVKMRQQVKTSAPAINALDILR